MWHEPRDNKISIEKAKQHVETRDVNFTHYEK